LSTNIRGAVRVTWIDPGRHQDQNAAPWRHKPDFCRNNKFGLIAAMQCNFADGTSEAPSPALREGRLEL